MSRSDPATRTYHVWFSTKHRKPALVDDIRDAVLEVFNDVARRTGIRLMAAEAIEDHVHLVLQLGAEKLLSTAVHDLKGASAREVFRRFPDLRLDMGTNSFWQISYGWRRVPDCRIEIVREYVQTQARRPLRHE